ncbi:MAG: hypothetical protein NT173_02800 [Opitutales bacterium]|nr:hypothetical protein [Opitutales bacterium]
MRQLSHRLIEIVPLTPITKKSGPIPVYARNQTDLGKYLMPPRDRKIIQLPMKREGCPGRTADGRYEVAVWQTFISQNFASASSVGQPDKQMLELEKLRLQNERLTFELDVRRKAYSANTDVELWVGELVMAAKRVLLSIPAKLAPQLAALTSEVEIELRLREEINADLAQLTARPSRPVSRGEPNTPIQNTSSRPSIIARDGYQRRILAPLWFAVKSRLLRQPPPGPRTAHPASAAGTTSRPRRPRVYPPPPRNLAMLLDRVRVHSTSPRKGSGS